MVFKFSEGLKEIYIKRLKIDEENLYSAVEIARKNKNINFESSECKFNFENTTKIFIEKVNLCLKKHKKFILIIGDSHAVDLFNSVAHYSSHPFIISLAQGGCRPGLVNKSKKCHYQNSINFVHFYKNHIKTIIFNQKGSYFLTNYKELPILEKIFENTKLYLNFLKTDKKLPIFWFGPHAEPNIDLKKSVILLQSLLVDNKKMEQLEIKGIYDLDKYLMQNLEGSNIKYISQLKLVNYNFSKDFYVNNNITYSDTDHWSEFGEKYFGKRLIMNEEIKKILN